MSPGGPRPFEPGDEVAVNRGFERVFGAERSLDEWVWKFPAVPGGRPIMLVEEDGEVIAHFAAIPVPLQLDGAILWAGQVVDSYASRRVGLARNGPFVRTVRAFYERFGGAHGLSLIYGFPGERHLRLGTLLLGYRAPRLVTYHRRDLTTGPRTWRVGIYHRLREGLDGAAADRLWTRAARRYPVAAVRDGAWFRRRFDGRPAVEYLHARVEVGGEPVAWAVARVQDEALHLADLLWDGRDPRSLEVLAGYLEEWGRERGARVGHLWLDGDPQARRVLARWGWLAAPEPQSIRLGAVAHVAGLRPADFCRRMYVTMGDADLI